MRAAFEQETDPFELRFVEQTLIAELSILFESRRGRYRLFPISEPSANLQEGKEPNRDEENPAENENHEL